MLKYISILSMVFGLSMTANAGATAQSTSRYNDIVSKLQFWDIANGQTPVYYGKVNKGGGYYQCIAIAFISAEGGKIDYAFKMWAASPHSASGDCNYRNDTDRVQTGVGKPACMVEVTQNGHKKGTRDMSLKSLGIIAKVPNGYFYRTLDFNMVRGNSKFGRAGLLSPCTVDKVDAALTAQKGSDYYQGRLTTGMINVEVENGMFKMQGTNGLTYMVNTDDPRNLMAGEQPPSTKFNVD